MVRDGRTYRLLTDLRASVRLVVDAATGEVAQRLDYDEYGRVLQDTCPGFQPFGFAGGLYDPATGLVRFGARDYDPQTGRFTAADPQLFGQRGHQPLQLRAVRPGEPGGSVWAGRVGHRRMVALSLGASGPQRKRQPRLLGSRQLERHRRLREGPRDEGREDHLRWGAGHSIICGGYRGRDRYLRVLGSG